MNFTLLELQDDALFVRTAADHMATCIRDAIQAHGACSIGLSGGSTPRPVYAALGALSDINWSKVHVFLADERYISDEQAESNQRLVRDTLPHSAHFVFPDTSLPLDECVRTYGEQLRSLWSETPPALIVLGMGDDGHIASLFPPNDSYLQPNQPTTLHTTTEKFAVYDRITLSLSSLIKAEHFLLLLKGEAKKTVWEEMMSSDEGAARWPMKKVLETGKATVILG